MKKAKIISLIFLMAVIAVFCGCEKVIEPKDLPDQDAKIVLNCIIYNDSAVRVDLSSSKSILSGKPYKYVNNANCSLYEDDQFIEQFLPASSGNSGEYKGSYIPKISKKYTVRVSASGYPDVEGTSNMRGNVSVTKVERYDTANSKYFQVDDIPSNYHFVQGVNRYRITVKDDPTQTNYYNLSPRIILYDVGGKIIPSNEIASIVENGNGTVSSGFFGYGNSINTTDEKIVNGSDLILDVDVSLNFSSTLYPPIASIEIVMAVSNLSEDVYKYSQTLLNQQTLSSANWFSEPVIIYNNIKNGMGIVGCINTQTFSISKSSLTR